MPRHAQKRRTDRLAVLDLIARSPGPVSQRQIQRALTLSSPSVAHAAVHALARDGLLTITPSRRGLIDRLELTEAGHAALRQWREAHAPADHSTARGAP
jgi:Mn-dependent DtxR family transcriptional regulator